MTMPRRIKAEPPAVDASSGDALETDDGSEKNLPVHSIRIRNVRAAVWRNVRADGSAWHSVTFSRSYKDQNDGTWHTSESFGGTDLLILAEVARQVFVWIVETTQSDTPF
jgi:hypothetical protein